MGAPVYQGTHILGTQIVDRMKHQTLLLVIFGLAFTNTAIAGLFGGDSAQQTAKVASILEARDSNIKKINELRSEIEKLQTTILEQEKRAKIIQKLKEQLNELDLNSDPSIKADLEGKIETQNQLIGSDSSLIELRSEITKRETNINQIQTELSAILAKLTGELTGDQSFKRSTSGYYAILIGVVILGFFVIAWKDSNVRKNIFSGESGIQFVTLFSLVIAIILFGVLGVLEGKELSALLGGLSGYILGRGTPPAGIATNVSPN